MTTWTPGNKNTSIFSNASKNTSSFSNIAKTLFNQFLLKEDSSYLLLETGDKIILDQNVPAGDTWSNLAKT